MKILIYGIHFFPDSIGVAKYSWEMAEWLKKRGHQVRAIMPPPYYPQWRLSPDYTHGLYHRETISGVRIWRCPLWVPSRPSGLKRILYQASFALSTLPIILLQVFWRPDIVLLIEPPLLCAPATLLTAWLARSRSWLHVQDFEVDMAFDLGLLKSQWLRKMALKIERGMMSCFDRISSISLRMQERTQTKGVLADRLVFFPNWVDVQHIIPLKGLSLYRHELCIPADTVVAMYSGNMGAKQGIEILAEVAEMLLDVPDLLFVFCGNGSARAELERRCDNLPNVRILDLQPAERLGQLLGLADIHLLPQRADAADLVMPSKLTGMLASGRPIVATANIGTELASVVQEVGLVVPPDDLNAFADAVKRLSVETDLRQRLGVASRCYAELNLDKEIILSRFESELLAVVG